MEDKRPAKCKCHCKGFALNERRAEKKPGQIGRPEEKKPAAQIMTKTKTILVLCANMIYI